MTEALEDQESQESLKFKFLRLTPEIVTQHWEAIKQSIIMSAPPTITLSEKFLSNMLQELLSDKMLCWVLSKESKVYAIVTTTFMWDSISEEKGIILYSCSATKSVSLNVWKYAIDKIKLFAKSKSCNRMYAYTENERILDIVRNSGANTDIHFILWEF